MDSDSDNFESADENLSSDEEETTSKKHEEIKEKELKKEKDEVKVTKNVLLEEKNDKNATLAKDDPTGHEKTEKIQDDTLTLDKSLSKGIKTISLEEKSEENQRLDQKHDEKPTESRPKDSNQVDEKIIQDQENHEKLEKSDSFSEKSVSDSVKDDLPEEKCDKPKIDETSKPTPEAEICEKIARKHPPERKERPSKMKSKLGVKLGTRIDKKPTFDENITSKKITLDPEPCWEDETGWEAFETEKYSKSEKDGENFWNDEEQYMEIPKKENFHGIADKMSAGDRQQSSWGSWGNWGVSSILSTASLGVSTLTSSVSQGITTVLETGIGIPDPEELARLDKQDYERLQEQTTPEEPPKASEKSSISLGIGNFVSGVTHITKLVETTGTKVLSGGLDTLETIGKKTIEVLQDGDPGFKKKKKFLGIDDEKPVLSHVLREAKEKAEEENKFLQERHFEKKAHYETLFDDHQGLVHLEALEMLSKQCDIKLENLLESKTGNELTEFQETLAQIKELCELPEDEEDTENDIELISEKLNSAVDELNVKISYDNLVRTMNEIDDWLSDVSFCEKELHQKSIETLAKLTAISVEQFHKAGELLLVKERRSTVDEADSLVQLTTTLTSLIGMTANKFSEKLNALAEFSSAPESVNSLITNIFLEAANSSSYIQDAFHLLIPVLQVGAV